jgi:predicted DNA-binding protein (MmcQ/YjbR family)
MPKEAEPLARMREICLSLPNTSEGSHFGQRAFKVGKQMFATCGDKRGEWEIVVQLTPAHARAIVRKDPRFKPYTRAPHCVLFEATGVIDWAEVRDLVGESYRLNAPARKRPKQLPPDSGKT